MMLFVQKQGMRKDRFAKGSSLYCIDPGHETDYSFTQIDMRLCTGISCASGYVF